MENINSYDFSDNDLPEENINTFNFESNFNFYENNYIESPFNKEIEIFDNSIGIKYKDNYNTITNDLNENENIFLEDANEVSNKYLAQNKTTNDNTIKNDFNDNKNYEDNQNINNLLNKKRKSPIKEEKSVQKSNNEILEEIKNDITPNKYTEIEEQKKTKRGRKYINETRKGSHDKNADDNIIVKIKTYLLNKYVRNIVKEASNGKYELKKFSNDLTGKVKRDLDLKLLKTKICSIYKEKNMSSKYSTYDKNENAKIIDEIYEEKEKNKTIINILELTFQELLILFRQKLNYEKDQVKLKEILSKFEGKNSLNDYIKYNDVEYFVEEIRKKNNDNAVEYIEKVEKLCCTYEEWLFNKKGRRSRNEL